MCKIIITGAGGFIGSHTYKELLRLGHPKSEIVPLDIRDSVLFPEIKIIKCDILSPELANYIEKGDKILHLCAIPVIGGDNKKMFRINVEGQINLAECALAKGAERIVFSSSGAVYFGNQEIYPPVDENTPTQPNTYYGFSKVVAENVLKMHQNELPFIILRYGYIYGRGSKDAISLFLNALSENKSSIIFGGHQIIEKVYVKDVVQANILALNTSSMNEIYNIGSGTSLSIYQIYEICESLMNRRIEPIIERLRTWDPKSFWYNINKAVKNLGYSPKWTLTEGIKDMLREKRKKGEI